MEGVGNYPRYTMKKVLIAIPSYGGKMTVACAMSLVRAMELAKKVCDKIDIGGLAGCCYIAHARNTIASGFLLTDCDELVFLDMDLAFNPEALAKIIEPDLPIVGGAYPYRNKDQGWPLCIKTDENRIPMGNKELGLIEAHMLPTGFMKIQRKVFTRLQELHPKWLIEGEANGGLPLWDFFQTGRISEEDNRWYGEDVAFCYWCRKAGIRIWLEPRIDFVHGDVPGNYDKYLRSLPKAEIKK
jgi:hypothetical protein